MAEREGQVKIRSRFQEILKAVSGEHEEKVRATTRMILREPFSRQSWSELFFLMISAPFAAVAAGFVIVTLWAGLILAITFFGLAFIAFSVRGSRGIGALHRQLARGYLNEDIAEPEPFVARKGFLGWLQSSLRDRVGWRSMAYIGLKIPLAAAGVLIGIAFWWDAFFCITFPVWGGSGDPAVYGVPQFVLAGNLFDGYHSGFFYRVAVFLAGIFFALAAPWAVRGIVYLDRRVMRLLLAPDPLAVRVRSLEHARAQTVDASAATLRRIERDLHDGTQAQLVALAMRLGMAKEKLAEKETPDMEQIRQLVDDAHRGAKEAIVELRDLARGIHPPALDIGLEGALSTLAARSTIPTELTVSIHDRPTASIEAIAYFCVAELLANVAQHAEATHAIVLCTQQGEWLRVVVRDNGKGGAELSMLGFSSSGLVGLTDRVHAVDGRMDIVSPPRGPTVVTVDLPLHA
ncbi:MAG TPA: sensor domain-containing protein [Acidimicrobiales bacterium]